MCEQILLLNAFFKLNAEELYLFSLKTCHYFGVEKSLAPGFVSETYIEMRDRILTMKNRSDRSLKSYCKMVVKSKIVNCSRQKGRQVVSYDDPTLKHKEPSLEPDFKYLDEPPDPEGWQLPDITEVESVLNEVELVIFRLKAQGLKGAEILEHLKENSAFDGKHNITSVATIAVWVHRARKKLDRHYKL